MIWTVARMVLLSIVLLAGAGCTKTVMVPVSSCPAPPVIVMPELAVDRLPQKPGTSDALKALGEDHIVLKSMLNQCVVTLDSYRQEIVTK